MEKALTGLHLWSCHKLFFFFLSPGFQYVVCTKEENERRVTIFKKKKKRLVFSVQQQVQIKIKVFNPIARRTAKTPQRFGCSESNRVKQ